MQILRESSAVVESLLKRRTEISSVIHQLMRVGAASVLFKSGESLDTYLGGHLTCVSIEEGALKYSVSDTPLFLFEEGDVFLWGHDGRAATVSCDFATRLKFQRVDEFMSLHPGESILGEILSLEGLDVGIRDLLVVELFGEGGALQPSLRNFRAGEIILREGDAGTSVFTLANGKALVTVEGKEVGRIQGTEIFGTLAALTNSPRTATVIAEEACLVLEVPIEQFLPFLLSRPQTIMQVLREMASKIVHLNDVVTKAGKQNQLP